MSLLNDWVMFTKGKADFDPDHFANLFRDHKNPEDIKNIYSFHKNGDVASKRLISFFEDVNFDWYATPKLYEAVSTDHLLNIFAKFRSDVVEFLKENNENEVAEKVKNAEIIFNEDANYVIKQRSRNDIFHPEYFDTISDVWSEVYDCEFLRAYALKEALYQLSTDFDVTRYLVSPLTKFPNSFNNGYEFWRVGGIYCFYDDKVELSIGHQSP